MQSDLVARVDRRRFLGLGLVAGAAVAVGCDTSNSAPTQVTSPPTAAGNRNRLNNRKPVDKTAKPKTQPK
jgi:hypothetical protein